VADLSPPAVLACATRVTVAPAPNCEAVVPDLTSTTYFLAADDCSAVMTITQSVSAGTILAMGSTNPVTVTASDGAGNVTNCVVIVEVPGSPIITTQPLNVSAAVGDAAEFIVSACGPGQLNYQWQHTGIGLPGATGSSLALSGLATNDAGSYSVVVANSFGSTTSVVANLTVLQPPVILTQPRSLVAAVGGTASFSVAVTGSPPFEYQWRTNGVALAGETNSALSVPSVQPTDFADYTVVVHNAGGSVESDVAKLTPAVSPVIAVLGVDAAGCKLAFPTEFGPSYQVEYKYSPDEASWQILTNVPGMGLTVIICDPEPTGSMKLYRLHLQ
jgi:hypothetical protein